MTKQEALDWLNYRLQLDNRMGRNNHFTMTDIFFFMDFIKHRTGKDVHISRIVNSIKLYSESCMEWVEKLINYLVYTHKIEVIVGEDSFKIINYK